jgi:hypothetical protein
VDKSQFKKKKNPIEDELVSPKREGRKLERELCINIEITRHGERTDPNRI